MDAWIVARMPLKRANESYISGIDGIRFVMLAGSLEIRCRISHETLAQFGATVGLSQAAEIFETYRRRIELAASAKFDRSGKRDYQAVIVTCRDFEHLESHESGFQTVERNACQDGK
jgi:hypothetical protein